MKHAREQYGLSLGGGIGKLSGQAIRIGHLGSLNRLEVLGTLGGVELSFGDLGIDVEMGSGLARGAAVVQRGDEGRGAWRGGARRGLTTRTSHVR